MSLSKITCGVSTTSDLIGSVNGLIDGAPNAVQQRFLDALGSPTKYKYIVTGDSTRNSVSTPSIPYYTKQLAKVNFDVYNNSQSGQNAWDWKDNVGGATLQQAIDNTSGTGETTILEMSFGINKRGDANQIKADVAAAVSAYLSAKPDALIVFVSPVTTGTDLLVETKYQELADEFAGAVFASGKVPTAAVYSNAKFYADGTHPNINGITRVVNYVMSSILPVKAAIKMSMENVSSLYGVNTNLTAVVESGYWGTSTGSPVANSSWRRLTEIAVEPNYKLRVDHGGEKYDAIFMDVNKNYISMKGTTAVSGQSYREVTIPASAYFVRLNVSTTGTTYDSLGYTPTVSYEIVSPTFMYMQEINAGLSIGLPIVDAGMVDSAGLYGTAGQVPTSQGDGTWLWS